MSLKVKICNWCVFSCVILATRMQPFLSLETSSFGVFRVKFEAWCTIKSMDSDDAKLKVLPALVDDKLLQPILPKFALGTTTLKSALSALEDEYTRQSKPPNPEEEFQKLRTTPESAVENCERLYKLASYLELPEGAVRHRLFNSLSTSLQQATLSWLDANPKCSARDLANFVAKFPPDMSAISVPTCSAASIPRSGTSKEVCQHCQRRGHTKDRCFKLRVCYRCSEKGHIAKYCPKNEK